MEQKLVIGHYNSKLVAAIEALLGDGWKIRLLDVSGNSPTFLIAVVLERQQP